MTAAKGRHAPVPPGPALLATAVLLLALPSAASAQVSTNTGALNTLGPAHHAGAHAAAHAGHPAGHHAAPRAAGSRNDAQHQGGTRAAAARHGHAPAPASAAGRGRIPTPTMHPRPPPIPIIAPPALHVDLHPPPPPPPVVADPKAEGIATIVTGPGNETTLRITFGPGSAAVNPTVLAALHAESAALKANVLEVATIDAFAPGTPDDPSSPRRLSLARALVARAVMINDGISSTRIYARALGTIGIGGAGIGDGTAPAPPNRIDIALAPLGRERPMPTDTPPGATSAAAGAPAGGNAATVPDDASPTPDTNGAPRAP